MTAVRAVDRWFRADVPAERLAMFRVLVGAYALVFLLVRVPHLMSYARADAAWFDPVGVVSLVDAPVPAWLTRGLVVLAIVLAGMFLVGFHYRVTAPLFAVVLLWVLTYSNSFSKILHTDNALMLHVIVLAVAPAADAVSWDARHGLRRGVDERALHGAQYGWALKLAALVCTLIYVLAGIAKLRNSGFAFFSGENLRNYIAFDNLRKLALGSVYSPIGVWMLPYVAPFAALAWLSMVLELFAPVALLHRRIGVVWVVCVWGFHFGVLVLMAITFFYQLTGVAFAPFFRLERLLDRRPFSRLRG